MIIAVNVSYEMGWKLVQECLLTTTKLDGLVASEINVVLQPRHVYFGMKVPTFVKHMRMWGETGVVKIRISTSLKLKYKGVTCLFAAHAECNDGDCCRIWDPIGHYVYVTRDAVRLKCMCFTQNNAT